MNAFNDINLLVTVVTVVLLVDEVSVAEVERVIANGMATDTMSKTTKADPPKTEEIQREFIVDDDALFLLLERIVIVY